MSDKSFMADTWGLEHLEAAASTREAFEASLVLSQSGNVINQAVRMVEQPGGLDLSPILTQGEAEKTVSYEYTGNRLKGFENVYPYEPYHYSLYVEMWYAREFQLRGKDILQKASEIVGKHAQHALTQLGGLITNGDNVALWRSRVDEADPAVALFSDAHVLGPTTWSNHEDANLITAAGNIEDNDANLRAALNGWYAIPDTDGRVGNFGNSRANAMFLISPNLYQTFEDLTGGRAILSSLGVAFVPYAANIPFVVIPGMADDSVVITRRPGDNLAGFYWGLDPFIHSAAKVPDADTAVFKWTLARKWCVAPSCAQSNFLIRA